MKKILLILSIVLAFTSCKKDEIIWNRSAEEKMFQNQWYFQYYKTVDNLTQKTTFSNCIEENGETVCIEDYTYIKANGSVHLAFQDTTVYGSYYNFDFREDTILEIDSFVLIHKYWDTAVQYYLIDFNKDSMFLTKNYLDKTITETFVTDAINCF